VQTVVGSATTEFVFDASGARVSEWNAATHAQLQGSYYWQGKPLAYYTTAADTGAAVGTHFEHLDYMGTERLRTNYNSANNPTYAVEATFAEQPFGDNKQQTLPGGADTDANHYAFLDTDKETATDHADFRQYSNAQGRWMAPDPYDGSYDFGNPQSLNRYVYASNSPFSYTDGKGAMDENGAGVNGCEMDGTDVDCSIVYSALAMGSAAECPNDNCHGWSGNSIVQFGCNPECGYNIVYTIPDNSNNVANDQDQQCGGGNGKAPNNASCNAPNNAHDKATHYPIKVRSQCGANCHYTPPPLPSKDVFNNCQKAGILSMMFGWMAGPWFEGSIGVAVWGGTNTVGTVATMGCINN
jgi:RHS repeat-associated protein